MGFFDTFGWFFHIFSKLSGRHKNFLRAIVSEIDLDGKRILDLGGGSGIMANLLLKYTNDVTVVDPTPKMLSLIRNSVIKKKLGGADKIPFKDKSFDIVMMVESLHHVTNDHSISETSDIFKQVVKEIKRVLVKNGVIVLVELNPNSVVGKSLMWQENHLLRENNTFFSKEQLKKLFSGYEVKFKDINRHNYLAVMRKY